LVTLSSQVDTIFSLYNTFLKTTDTPKNELIEMFKDRDKSQDSLKKSKGFGDQVYQLLCSMGKDNKVLRILIV